MSKALEIIILICLPLVWGLTVEFALHHLLRGRRSAEAAGRDGNDDEWIE